MDFRAHKQMTIQNRYGGDDEGKRLAVFAREQIGNDEFDADEYMIALSIDRKVYYLNTVAGIVFQELALGTGRDELEQTLADLFEVDPDELAEDVEQTIEGLVAKGILEQA